MKNKNIILTVIFILLTISIVGAIDYPKLTGYVNDLSFIATGHELGGILSDITFDRINEQVLLPYLKEGREKKDNSEVMPKYDSSQHVDNAFWIFLLMLGIIFIIFIIAIILSSGSGGGHSSGGFGGGWGDSYGKGLSTRFGEFGGGGFGGGETRRKW